ncbi:MAG: hypothetical protein AB8B83_08130, partial [Bdellovibrionales bacterium]
FILWDAGQKQVIGITVLEHANEDNAVFAHSDIIVRMHNQKLSRLLYEARFRLLSEQNFEGNIHAEIASSKNPSIKAAMRHGFKKSADMVWNYCHEGFVPMPENYDLESHRSAILEPPKPRVDNPVLQR